MSDIPPWFGERLYPFSHFLGYRPTEPRFHSPSVLDTLRESPWGEKTEFVLHTLVASWVAIVFLALMSQGAGFKEKDVPMVIAAYGAVAVLLFSSYLLPASQPRCILLGNTVCAILGVSVTKLFALSGRLNVDQPLDGVAWACAATSLSVGLAACQILEVTHPPGGAVAILAATNPEIQALGWFFIPAVITSSVIMIAWGCVVNNIFRRRYPVYWISPAIAYEQEQVSEESLEAPEPKPEVV